MQALEEGSVTAVVASGTIEDDEVARCRSRGFTIGPSGATRRLCGVATEPATVADVLPLFARRKGAALELLGGTATARLEARGGIGAPLRSSPSALGQPV
jgi:hypothetical protein